MPTERTLRLRAKAEIARDPHIAPILNKVIAGLFDPEPKGITLEHFELISEPTMKPRGFLKASRPV